MSDKAKQHDRNRKLGHHRGGILAPTDAQIARFAFVQNGHRFLREGARRRLSDADCQMYVRDKYGGSFNVVRLLLERAGRLDEGRTWMNQCGFSECIDVDHWAPTRPPAKGAAAHYRLVVLDHDVELYFDNARVRRDAALPALIAPTRDVAHIARFLYAADGSRFVTACGINIDPATLIPCAKAQCERCLM